MPNRKVYPVRMMVSEELIIRHRDSTKFVQEHMARGIGQAIAHILTTDGIIPDSPIYLHPVPQKGDSITRTVTLGVDIDYERMPVPRRTYNAIGTSLHEVMERANEDMRTHPERLRDSLFQNTKELTDGEG